MADWKVVLLKWLNGLAGGAIGGGANIITNLIVDPLNYNPAIAGWHKITVSAAVGALVGAALFLAKAPTPWNGVERRNDSPLKGEQVCNEVAGKL